ncbi:hypothetical protein ACIOC1_05985 [Streptomyces sp. NPDC088197]|uniref:hypothetical protein n=1 Tax=unclassified Streptomyces TaxID=2593676 RepID=UPI0036DFA5FF
MILKAQIPPIPESRGRQMPARLARKVGPLFGVAWDGAPGGMHSWCCDYAQVTLAEIMRGAPRPAKPSELGDHTDRGLPDSEVTKAGHTPIANATASRYGPDTKAAFVLIGTNVLLAPVTEALGRALDEIPVEDPHLLIGAFAYSLLEVFRSEPILLVAALQAQGVQHALGALDAPVRSEGVRSLASHEYGPIRARYDADHAPLGLDLVEKLATVLCARLRPRESNEVGMNEPLPGGSARDRLRRTVVGMAQATLFDLSAVTDDAAVRIVDNKKGRRAELHLHTEVRVRRFAQAVLPHVELPPQETPARMADKLSLLQSVIEETPSGPDLDVKAALTVRQGLVTATLALFEDRDESTRHVRARMLEQFADRVRELFGADSPEFLLERLHALADLVQFPAAQDEDPSHPQIVTRRAGWLREGVALAKTLMGRVSGGSVDGGYLATRLDDLLVGVNQLRKAQYEAHVTGLPDAEQITRELIPLWDDCIELLTCFFENGSPRYYVRLHNYCAFLVGAGSNVEMREEGLELYDNEVIPVRRRMNELGTAFTSLRNVLQVAMRGHVSLARDLDDPQRSREHLAAARTYAAEIRANTDEVDRLLEYAGERATGFVMALSLANCFLTSAEYALPDDRADRARWAEQAAELMAVAAPYVSGGQRNRADRRREFENLGSRLRALDSAAA